MKGNQYFKDKLKDFRQGILKSDPVGNGSVISDKLVSVEIDQILQFFIEDLELFSDELFEEENVSVFVDVVKSVDIWSDGSSELPSVCGLEVLETSGVSVDVFELTNVDKILGLN